MHQQRYIASREDRHGSAQLALANQRKLVDARRHEKTLEPADAGVDERVQLAGVAGHHAAPERDVDVALPARGSALRLERRHGRRRRHAVERHVDDGRDAAGRRRARRRGEPFPLGAARLVDVHVRVDEAGHDDEVADVDDGTLVTLG